jgi:hypothetical protein
VPILYYIIIVLYLYLSSVTTLLENLSPYKTSLLGGLYYQESKLVNAKVEIERQKLLFMHHLQKAGGTGISTTTVGDVHGVHKKLGVLGEHTLQYESTCVEICHRRAYAISQSLSIAVNSVLLKLALVVQGSIPHSVAEQWLQCGVLLIFEGLLSVVAHERSMLEDTISAVDALRSFQVRVFVLYVLYLLLCFFDLGQIFLLLLY